MNSNNKKPPTLTPRVAQAKSLQPKLAQKPPVAPPVYKPLPVPKVLQTKLRMAPPAVPRGLPQRPNHVVQNAKGTTAPRGIIQRAAAKVKEVKESKVDKALLDDTSMFTEVKQAGPGGAPIVVRTRTTTYYRKMSKAEFAKCYTSHDRYNFAGFFAWATGGHHRLWLTTSLAKCRGFSNEDYSSSSDVVVLFEFSGDLLATFKAKAHQEKGVQHNMSVVAIHREGFGDVGNMGSDEDVERVLGQGKGYSLGFGSGHAAALTGLLSYIKVLGAGGWAENDKQIAAVI